MLLAETIFLLSMSLVGALQAMPEELPCISNKRSRESQLFRSEIEA